MDNRLLRSARLALAVAERGVPDRASKFAPRRYRRPQLLACLPVKEHLGLDYRTMEEIPHASDGLRSSLGSARVPDHSTLWWHARHRVGPDLLGAALAETVRRVEPRPEPRQIALASTGLWLPYTSWYFAWRVKRDRGQRGWLKWAPALWTGPLVPVAQRVRPGPCGDFSDLVPLAASAHAVLPFDQLVADAGYDSEANRPSLLPRGAGRRQPDPGQEAPVRRRPRDDALPPGDAAPASKGRRRSRGATGLRPTLEGRNRDVRGQA